MLFTLNLYHFRTLPVTKVQGLGGKFGEKVCGDLGITYMNDLIRFSKEDLQKRYDIRNGNWLYNIARGIDLEAIVPHLVSKSIGCCKKFPGRNAITAIGTLNHWLGELAQEIGERLEQDEEENNRRPKQMVVSFIQEIHNSDVSSSRSLNLTSVEPDKIAADALDVLKRNTDKFFKTPDNQSLLNNPIKFLGLNVGKFESLDTKRGNTIQNMFQRTIDSKKVEEENEKAENCGQVTEEANKKDGKNPEAAPSTTDDSNKAASENIGFFAQHRLEQLEKQKKAAEEAARLAEEQQQEECSDEDDESRDKFDDDMLQSELDQSIQVDDAPNASKSALPEPDTATNQDYTMTYAEFYQLPALPKVTCEQCGKTVFEHEIQVHNDAHYAYQISQEQRVEFQHQLKRAIPPAAPASKKSKTTTTKIQTPTKSAASIEQFLKKPTVNTEPIASTSRDNDGSMVKCEECAKMLHPHEILEHMDFHAAKKLHDEIRRADLANRLNNNAASSTSKPTKSKKKQTTANCKNTGNSTKKNIATFFQMAKDDT